jgi:hypothetical protein
MKEKLRANPAATTGTLRMKIFWIGLLSAFVIIAFIVGFPIFYASQMKCFDPEDCPKGNLQTFHIGLMIES